MLLNFTNLWQSFMFYTNLIFEFQYLRFLFALFNSKIFNNFLWLNKDTITIRIWWYLNIRIWIIAIDDQNTFKKYQNKKHYNNYNAYILQIHFHFVNFFLINQGKSFFYKELIHWHFPSWMINYLIYKSTAAGKLLCFICFPRFFFLTSHWI